MQIYRNDHTLWAYDLTPDLGCEEGHLHPIRNVNVQFELEWSEALPHPINVLVYAEYNRMILIDGHHNVITE